jgi:MFS family permease
LLAEVAAKEPCRHPRATLVASILGTSIGLIDGSVINVALPAIDHEFNAGVGGLTYLLSAYLLMISSLVLLSGALGDHFGRRRMFLLGIAVCSLGTCVCLYSPSLSALVVGRALQGVGTALILPNSLALLGAAFDGDAKARAIGTWAGAGALVSAVAPFLAGWLVQSAGWRAIFLIGLPVAIVAAWLGFHCETETRSSRAAVPLDVRGAVLVSLGLYCVTASVIAAARPGGSEALLLTGGALGLVLLALFAWNEARRGGAALVPLFLTRRSSFFGVTALTFFLYAALGGFLMTLPFLLIHSGHYSPAQAGAALAPVSVFVGVGSRLTARTALLIGSRTVLATGSLTMAVGLALFTDFGTGPINYWNDVLPGTLLVALGIAMCAAPLTATVINSVSNEFLGAASGFNSTIARTGGLLSAALLTFVFAQQGMPHGFLEGVRLAALVGSAAAILAGASALLFIRPVLGAAAPPHLDR